MYLFWHFLGKITRLEEDSRQKIMVFLMLLLQIL